MASLQARLERLEATRPVPDPEEDGRARQALLAGLARYAELFHAEDEARAADPTPRPVLAPSSRSPMETLVRAAMDDAAQEGAWGSAGYGAVFWRSAIRRLGELLEARRAREGAEA